MEPMLVIGFIVAVFAGLGAILVFMNPGGE